jgi:DNA-binding transcriptional MerR regulator
MGEAARKHETLLRMKDLIARTGLTRDTIHFYIAEGLVPPPTEKRRNMAWYGREHLERLNAIKSLQQERFLPLKAIKAVLAQEERESSVSFTRGQTTLIAQLKAELREAQRGQATTVALDEIQLDAPLERLELEELSSRGVIDLLEEGGRTYVSTDDAEILQGLSAIKKVVDRPDGSWRPDDWAMLDRLASELIDYEIATFADRFPDVGSKPLDEVVNATIPIINRVFGILHAKKVRRFIMAFGGSPGPDAPSGPNQETLTVDTRRTK